MRKGIPDFTVNEAALEERACVDLIVVVSEVKLWRYSMCEQHAKQFVWASRQAGDEFTYFVFHRINGRFCPVCRAFEDDTAKDYVHVFPQTSRERWAV